MAIHRHLGQEGNQRHHGHRHRAGQNAHLAGNRRCSHGALGANVVLDGNVVDDGQHGVDHVPRAAQNGQQAGGEWCQDGNIFGVAAQNLFSAQQQHFKPAGCLQRGRGSHHRDDGQHHIDRWLARRQLENKGHEDNANAPQQTQCYATFSGAIKQADQNDGNLQENIHGELLR